MSAGDGLFGQVKELALAYSQLHLQNLLVSHYFSRKNPPSSARNEKLLLFTSLQNCYYCKLYQRSARMKSLAGIATTTKEGRA